jgi:hypothetical protein
LQTCEKATVGWSGGGEPDVSTSQPAKLLRQKLEMAPFKFLLFIHSLHMIFNLKGNRYDFMKVLLQ